MSRRCFGRLFDDQSGGITIFVLTLTILLLVAGGMAVDYQRYEQARADLQNALDRGVLAATNKNQLYDTSGSVSVDDQARDLIAQYFASRSYRTNSLNLTASVDSVTGGRQITAAANHPLETIFLRLIGINTMNVVAASGAIQGTPSLEITLVLDVSGSMGWNSTSAPGTKLAQLKVAAKQFLDTVLSAQNQAQTLVSIVPFSQQVNLPRTMADLYNLNRHHDYSSCFDYHSLDFDTTAMPTSPATAYVQGQHFRENVGSGNFGCPKVNNAITPFSDDVVQLKAAIDALATETWTATYMGMKWGAATLDPSSRPIVDALIASGDLPSEYAGWPLEWNDPNVRKITVLMSDGQNTKLNEIRESDYYAHPPSYWNTHNPTGSEKFSVIDGPGQGDPVLKQICDQAKIGSSSTVYTIGFELAGEAAAIAALEDCTSSLSTHYLVDGVDITTAFQNIADEIVNLKLIN